METIVIEKLNSILPTLYYNRDKSHGLNHIQRVLRVSRELLHNLSNTEKIILDQTDLTIEECKNIIEAAALLHDAWDHKYIKKESEIKEKKEFISYYLNDVMTPFQMKIVFDIVDNISYSREIKGLKKDLGKYEILRNIVSDADKLEALGSNSIDRMIIYNINEGKIDHYNHIVKHCKDKLFKLRNYIHTSYARDVALSYERQLKIITSDELILNNFINNRLTVLNAS